MDTGDEKHQSVSVYSLFSFLQTVWAVFLEKGGHFRDVAVQPSLPGVFPVLFFSFIFIYYYFLIAVLAFGTHIRARQASYH